MKKKTETSNNRKWNITLSMDHGFLGVEAENAVIKHDALVFYNGNFDNKDTVAVIASGRWVYFTVEQA